MTSPVSKAEAHALIRQLASEVYGVESLEQYISRVSLFGAPPRHMAPVLRVLSEATRRPMRAVISMPPRHTKTFTLAHAFSHWLTYWPGSRCCYATYGDRLARKTSRMIRNIYKGDGGTTVKDADSLHEWGTEQGGSMVATSVGGAITGMGFDGLVVVDDILRGRKDAESPTIRETAWEWLHDDLYTRLEGNASFILNGTRWHIDDPIGRWLREYAKKNDLEVITLRAIDDDGNALWPERYPIERLLDIKEKLGEYGFASLYEQRPRPRGLGVFKDPARFKLPTSDDEWADFLRDKHVVMAIDPAATAKTTADYSVIGVFAGDKDRKYGNKYVLSMYRGQWEIPDLVKRTVEIQKQWGCPIAVEAVGGFKAVPQALRRIDPDLRIREIHPAQDKYTRALPASAAWNAGKFQVPEHATWVPALLDEAFAFTGQGDIHDDQVDTLAHGYEALAKPIAVRKSTKARFAFG